MKLSGCKCLPSNGIELRGVAMLDRLLRHIINRFWCLARLRAVFVSGANRRHVGRLDLCLAVIFLTTGSTVLAADRTVSTSDARATTPSIEPQALDQVVATVNKLLQASWKDVGVKPSEQAPEGEWCRRVYLDLIGRIPSSDELLAFQGNDERDKRQRLVDDLLDSDEYIYHWATIWTNLLIGRTGGTDRRSLVDRQGLQKYLRDSLASEKPYDVMVQDFITATGVNKPGEEDFNGAVNFLLNNLEDNAAQATATTSRLFLGVQVQCTQCHNHPFNEWKQNQYWGMNAFFRQTRALRTREGRDILSVRLVDEDFPGESGNNPLEATVFYEDRRSTLNAIYPTFIDGTELTNHSGYVEDVVRRQELAMMILASPQLSLAIVNRTWGQLLGHGFTKPVDDMGPHNPPSHPDLLNYLAEQFVAGGYDLKQLLRWITASEAYALSSRVGSRNAIDDPSTGSPPLFSRFYLRQMSAEQLYDSLIVATAADEAGRGSYEDRQRVRGQWLRQFTIAFGTDEKGETSTFNGTIPQTLMMMNGELVHDATCGKSGSFVHEIAKSNMKNRAKVQRLYLAALARKPSPQELTMANKLWTARNGDSLEAMKDLWWVLLNSNEFILNH